MLPPFVKTPVSRGFVPDVAHCVCLLVVKVGESNQLTLVIVRMVRDDIKVS